MNGGIGEAFSEACRAVRFVDERKADTGGRRRSTVRSQKRMQVLQKHVRTERGEDLVLVVEEAGASGPTIADRRAGSARRLLRQSGAQLLYEDRFDVIPRSQLGSMLDKIDAALTPRRGLSIFDLKSESWLNFRDPFPKEGRVLLIIHGTFSNCENLLTQLTDDGGKRDFFRFLQDRYDYILAFDHPTMAMAPLLNAKELDAVCAGSTADIHVIAHSRGGLVTRWWLEGFDAGRRQGRTRVVYLGVPLAGTSLAAPPSLRSALSLLANIGAGVRALDAALSIKLFALTAGLFQVITSTTSLLSKTPVVDATLALVPGLKSQSRIGNNHELQALRKAEPALLRDYAFVTTNFEPDDVGWAFWRMIPDARIRVFDRIADRIFKGDNDLVVDLPSMTSLHDRISLEKKQILNFGTSSKIHHLNYLSSTETLEFIRSWFEARSDGEVK